jgi:hypothetical protein
MKPLIAALLLFTPVVSRATENGLTHVYQPLESLHSGIEISRVPWINGLAFPESIVSSVAAPFKALQSTATPVADSNLASLYGIKLSSENLQDNRYRIDLDVRTTKQPQHVRYTRQEVVEATLMCLRLMFPAGGTWKISLRIISSPDERTQWEPYEKAFFPTGAAAKTADDGTKEPAK